MVLCESWSESNNETLNMDEKQCCNLMGDGSLIYNNSYQDAYFQGFIKSE